MAIKMHHDLDKALKENADHLWLKDAKDLKELPAEIFQLKRLKRLIIDNGSFETISPEIANLKRLTHLVIRKSKLKSLPKEIGQLDKLTHLELFENQMEAIPKEVCQLSRLKFLYLHKNCLTEVPSDLHLLSNLQELNLHFNELVQPPEKLEALTALREFRIQGNPLKVFPLSLFLCKRRFLCYLPNEMDGEMHQDDLWGFIKRCQKFKVALHRCYDYFQIAKKDDKKVAELERSILMEAMNSKIPNVAIHALEYVTASFDPQSIHSNSNIMILAKTNIKKKDLENRLQKIGIQVSNKYTEKTTHILIKENSKGLEDLVNAKVCFMKEQQLVDYLDEHDTPYILDESEGVDITQIAELLLSMKDENIGVALGLLESGGVPNELLTLLFAASKLADQPKVRKQAKQLLLSKASAELVKVCNKRIKLEHSPVFVTVLHKAVDEYCEGTELDGALLAYAIYKKSGVGIGYALSFGKSDLKQRILRELVTLDELELSAKEWIKNFPLELYEYASLKKLRLKAKLTFSVLRSEAFNRLHLLEELEELEITGPQYSFSEPPTFLAKMPQLKKLRIQAYKDAQEAIQAVLPNCEMTFIQR